MKVRTIREYSISTLMLHKSAVAKCAKSLSAQNYFFFDFAHLFIKTQQKYKKAILNHTGTAITLIRTWSFFTF